MQRLPTPEMSAIVTNVTNQAQILRKVIDNVETDIHDVGKIVDEVEKGSDKRIRDLERKQRDFEHARTEALGTAGDYLTGAFLGMALNLVLFR
jgi:hypothetical protein